VSLDQTRRREQAVQRLVHHLASTVDGIDEQAAREVLAAANAVRGRPLHELDVWLREHPDALTNPGPHCPASLVRLAHALHDTGHSGVVLPGCVRCRRTLRNLVAGPDGRVCIRCDARARTGVCARCGREGRILARRAEGGICGRCYRRDEQVIRPCARCGRQRQPVARLEDGSAVCDTCWQPPARTCTRCGTTASTHYRGPNGALCHQCYRQEHQPRRRCSRCGQTARIATRSADGTAEVCYGCYRRPTIHTQCSTCGRTRICQRTGRPGLLVCSSCRPWPRVACARCARERIVAANWPIGPVCHACYQIILRDTGDCARCGTRRPLIGRDQATTAGTTAGICGPCAGSGSGPQCRACGDHGGLYADGQCPRCVLRARLTDLLTGPDGTITAQLTPLLDALNATQRPLAVLKWLARSPAARLLAHLAAHGRPISHDDLNTMPLGHSERYVRALLTHTGVLPERHIDLERVEVWLDQLLADRPAAHARLIRPFATWHLLRRARRDALRRAPTTSTIERLRSRIRIALDLLTWIDAQHHTLATLNQTDLDQWLAAGARHRHTVRHFLAWAAEHRLTPTHDIPSPPQQAPAPILDDDQRWRQLQRCLTDQQLPAEVRVAGALILLYGLTASRIRLLTTNDLTADQAHTYLTVGAKPLPLPPSLARLVEHLIDKPRHPSALTSGTNPSKQWLFPGLVAGQPLTVQAFSQRLTRHGIPTLPSRSAALIAMAGRLPTPILADILGIHIHTARRWATYLQPDWSTYLATRDTDQQPEEE
jgi:hypothetical protein